MDDAPSRRAAFFDVDNTVIRGASAYQLALAMYRRRFFGLSDILRFGLIQTRYLLFGESERHVAEVRGRGLMLIRGRSVAEVTALGEEVYDAVLSLRIYEGTKRLIDEHLERGDQVWLVTATPVEIGRVIARRIGATGCIGTQAEHRGGYYTGGMIGDLMHGKTKAAAVAELAAREGLDLEASFAYSDSLNDLPLLELVGHPSPINPDAKLRRYASDVGWPIREFRGKNRRVARRSASTASLAGAAWVAGLVWSLVRRGLRRRLDRLGLG